MRLRRRASRFLLVRNETSPEDLRGMIAAEGILTAKGGVSSHAALVARQMGKVCVCGASELADRLHGEDRHASRDGPISEGDYLSINGTVGEVYPGRDQDRGFRNRSGARRAVAQSEGKQDVRAVQAADGLVLQGRRVCQVRTNADTPEQTANAVAFGATGIGLCRTEHMFFEGERIDAMREMILAESVEDRKKALAKLLPYQREDFVGIFKALNGYAGDDSLPRSAAA